MNGLAELNADSQDVSIGAPPTEMHARRSRLFESLAAAPYEHDFFRALRRIECLFPAQPRFGEALGPSDEPIRFGQAPSLEFTPATLRSFGGGRDGGVARLEVAFFGLLGPNGPLPLHLTEFARERILHEGDETFARFLDVFNHRFLTLFYRAWAQGQPTVNLDRPSQDHFARYVGSTVGLGTAKSDSRDAVPDHAKLFFAGLLVRQARNADGLAAILIGFFRLPVRVEEYVGHWMSIPAPERSRFGNANASLGAGAVLGSRVWDRQSKFRIWVGPLSLPQYESFLPGGEALRKLVSWVRQYFHLELEWDVRLMLKADEVPRAQLSSTTRLGWTTWLGRRACSKPAADLTLDVERVVSSFGA